MLSLLFQNDFVSGAHQYQQNSFPIMTSVSKGRPRPCPFCNLTFYKKIDLTKHLEQEHGVLQKHRCHICTRSFTTDQGLQYHLVQHTGQHRYQCLQCGKKFAQKSHYIGHQNIHAGAKPFQCKKCLKCYAYPQHLSNHKKTCPGGNPY